MDTSPSTRAREMRGESGEEGCPFSFLHTKPDQVQLTVISVLSDGVSPAHLLVLLPNPRSYFVARGQILTSRNWRERIAIL